jgi:hypothetical protein
MGTWDGGAPVMVGYGWFINPIDAIDIADIVRKTINRWLVLKHIYTINH